MRKFLSVLLVVLMVFSSLPLQALPVLAGSSDLGTVKVRVADEVQRTGSGLGDYQEPFGEILPWTEVDITEGMTMLGAVEAALGTKDISVDVRTHEDMGDYIVGIGPVTSQDGTRTVEHLSEFDGGSSSGWMVTLNDWFINASVGNFTVQDGDVVEFLYTCSLGADIGGSGSDSRLKSLKTSDGLLNPDFHPDTLAYTLILQQESKIMVQPVAANKHNKVTIQSGESTYRPTDPIGVENGQTITITSGGNTYEITVQIADDQGMADAVIAMIEALPKVEDLVWGDQSAIKAARAAFDALNEAQQALVTNIEVLKAAEARLEEIEEEDQEAADRVIALINALPTLEELTLEDEVQVVGARVAYNALSESQKQRVNNLSVLKAAEDKIAELLDPGVQNHPHDFLLSTLSLEVKEGERKEIVVFDTPRVGGDDRAYNREDLVFTITQGEAKVVVESENPSGTPEGTKYFVKGLQPGLAEIRITYEGYQGLDAVMAVNVLAADAAGPELETDIEVSKYDILYFTGDSLDFTFHAESDDGASIYALLRGQTYTPEEGEITVDLREGYNVLEVVAAKDGKSTTKIYNIRAKKMSYTIHNLTRPGSESLYEGDRIRITYGGLVIPVPKVSRIYNPAAVGVRYFSDMPRYSLVSGAFSQYDLATSNGLEFELTGAGDFLLSGGHIFEDWFGSGLYSETPVGQAPPVTGAGQSQREFSQLPDIPLTVLENEAYNPELFTAEVDNVEEIWPGDQVTIRISDLDIDTLRINHTTTGSWIVDLLDSYTSFATDIPGLDRVQSVNVESLDDLEKLKTIRFTIPEDTPPGTYRAKGGYVWVKHGPTWWTRETTYFTAKIPDVVLEVVEGQPGIPHGTVQIDNDALKTRLAVAAGKGEDYPNDLTKGDLANITDPLDLSDCDITDDDMGVMEYLAGVSAIDFSNNPAITSTTVKAEAFHWDEPKSLDFSGCSGITEIERAAFKDAGNLKGIILPESVLTIGDEGFRASGLEGIDLPDSIITIGEMAFLSCSNLSQVIMPANLESLGSSAFASCSALEEMELPDNLTAISDSAFYGSRALEKVQLPKNLETIGEGSFRLTALKEINFPDSLKNLGRLSFTGTGLTEVRIPAGVTEIGDSSFSSTPIRLFDVRGTDFTSSSGWGLSRDAVVLFGEDAKLQPASQSITLGAETLPITHSIPEDKNMVWGSINSTIAIVEDGVVTGVQPGEVIIYAKAEDNSYSGYSRVEITDDGRARLETLILEDIDLNEELEPEQYIYSAAILGDVRSTRVTATTEEEGATMIINGEPVARGQKSQEIPLDAGRNTIRVEVTSPSGEVTKIYTINITMKDVHEGEDHLILGNGELQKRLAAKIDGKDPNYIGPLTFIELAGITGKLDLSKANIDDGDMAVIKYLQGVSAIDFSGNEDITSNTVKADTFDWTSLTSLDFRDCDGITSISSSAFQNTANLVEIYLPDSVERLQSRAFSNATNLKTITIPGVKQILGNAFSGCTSLTDIELPDGLESIGDSAFFLCTALTEINIPDSVSMLGSYSFAQTGLKEIRFPTGITQLPYLGVNRSTNLSYAYIPGTITGSVGSTFSGASLRVLDLRDTENLDISNWGVPDVTTVLYPGQDAALSQQEATIKLGEETLALKHGIPEGKTLEWGSSDSSVARVDEDGLVSGIAPGTAVIYVKTADNSYSGICRVNVVSTENARLEELSLEDISFNEDLDPARVYYTATTGVHQKSTSVIAKAEEEGSIIKINGKPVEDGQPSQDISLTLGNNTILVQVTTPDGEITKTFTIVVKVARLYHGEDFVAVGNKPLQEKLATAAGKNLDGAEVFTFAELAGISGSLDLSDCGINDEDMEVMQYLTGAGDINLSNNPAITAAMVKADTFDWSIPKSLDFSGCRGITEISQDAFRDQENLIGIVLPQTITTLFGYSFSNTGLTEIQLPEGLETIGAYAFEKTGLKSIDIPSSVKTISNWAFQYSLALTQADLSGADPDGLGSGLFRGCTAITDLGDIKLPEGLTALPSSFFSGCTGLIEIQLPENITAIGGSAFSGCTGVISADLSGITQAGSSVFQDCTALETVYLSPELAALERRFFSGAINLRSLELPAGLESIGNEVFRNTNLTFLSIPGGVREIGRGTFSNMPLAVLDLSKTEFAVSDTSWAVPDNTFVLYPGADAGLTASSDRVAIGQSLALEHAIPWDKNILWRSSDLTTASILNGVVTGVDKGTAVIALKASDNSYAGVYTVTVYDPVPEVMDLIESLPGAEEITLEDKGQVQGARAAYNALTTEQKTQIDNIEKLEAAEAKIGELHEDAQTDFSKKIKTALKDVKGYIQSAGYSSDWIAVGHGAAGERMPESYLEDLVPEIDEYFKERVNTSLERVTDHQRWALAINALGGDPRNVAGHDLIERIYNFSVDAPSRDITFQGLNGVIFALIALDSREYEIPSSALYDREWMLDYLLERQNDDGGWNLSGSGISDPDITAMALTALAPYHDREDVRTAVRAGAGWLSENQNDQGGYSSFWGEASSESISQVIIALCANGIDPTGYDYTKKSINLVEALLNYQREDGAILHTLEGVGVTGMATEQGYQALLAYEKFVRMGGDYLEGKTSIYHMKDIALQDHVTVIMAIAALPDGITLNHQEQITAARTAYAALTSAEKELVSNLGKLEEAEKRLAELMEDKDKEGESDDADRDQEDKGQDKKEDLGNKENKEPPKSSKSANKSRSPGSPGSGGQTVSKSKREKESPTTQGSVMETIGQAKTGDSITFTITEDLGLTAALLDELKTKEDITITFRGEGYSMTFNTNDLGDYREDLDVDLRINFTPDNQDALKELAGNPGALVLDFSYSGVLPAPLTIRVELPDILQDADTLYLYLYNEERKELELVPTRVVIEEGWAVFTLEHFSQYVLTDIPILKDDEVIGEVGEAEKKEREESSSFIGSTPFYLLLALLALAIILGILWKKRKQDQ